MKTVCFVLMFLISLDALALAGTCPPIRDKMATIDKVMTKYHDVDGDGIPDKIDLHITATNFYAPFKWEFTITSKDKVIYRISANNENIDKSFYDPSYLGETCDSYDDCKCKWYFYYFLEGIMEKVNPDDPILKKNTGHNSIYTVASHALRKERKKNPALVKRAIENAIKGLASGKLRLLVVPYEPEAPTPPMVWMPEFNRFVPIYEE